VRAIVGRGRREGAEWRKMMRKMGCWLTIVPVLFLLVACGGAPTATPDPVATEVAVARAVAATLTAEAPATAADLVATQVAAARAAMATLTAEAVATKHTEPAATTTPSPIAEVEQELGGGLKLVAQESQDDGQGEFGTYIWAPRLLGPDETMTVPFNRAVEGFVAFALDDFRQGALEVTTEPGSSIWITHTVTLATEDLVSVLFYVDGYVMGAAHPFHYSYSVNYDTEQTRVLGLGDLFLPDTGYLEILSGYCLDNLTQQGVLAWEEGALPAPENYQQWNITPEGLLISFDEYTVAPYAAGPQSVVVPYAVLEGIVAPEGPLVGLTR
jgi:hypothetical protein